jgi:Protein of unknown function (DUF2934)
MASRSLSHEIAQNRLEMEQQIRRRAHEIHQEKGGSELDNWLEAEREVLGRSAQPAQDRGSTVGSARRPSRDETRNLGAGNRR